MFRRRSIDFDRINSEALVGAETGEGRGTRR
jgi:hypothetical protein